MSPAFKPAPRGANLARVHRRERDVLRLLADGKDDRQIASELDISLNTVRTHLRNIFQKLHVSSRAEAIVLVLKRGVFRDDET